MKALGSHRAIQPLECHAVYLPEPGAPRPASFNGCHWDRKRSQQDCRLRLPLRSSAFPSLHLGAEVRVHFTGSRNSASQQQKGLCSKSHFAPENKGPGNAETPVQWLSASDSTRNHGPKVVLPVRATLSTTSLRGTPGSLFGLTDEKWNQQLATMCGCTLHKDGPCWGKASGWGLSLPQGLVLLHLLFGTMVLCELAARLRSRPLGHHFGNYFLCPIL